ncbi:MAG: hypothetical protein O7D32_03635 [bacterium]|nr:hypothetical protein [bacterium]
MMRLRSRALIAALVILSMVLATAVIADGLASPLKKKLAPGVTTVSYGGETLTFTTTVFLQIEFRMIGSVNAPIIEIKAAVLPGNGGPQGTSGTVIQIYWEDQGEELYSGSSNWTGEIPGEGGWTEK